MSAFEELGICPEIIRAVEEEGWLLPTAIQQEVIPNILTGRDVCAAAETGSGKTGAFGMPCCQIVHELLVKGCASDMGEVPAATVSTRLQPDINDKDPQVLFTQEGGEIRCDNDARWQGIRCNPPIASGKYCFEATLLTEGLTRIGISTAGATLDLGCDSHSWGFGSTGKKSYNRTFDTYGRPFRQGDTISVLIDKTGNTVEWAINGERQGVAFGIVKDRAVKAHVCGKGAHVKISGEDLLYTFEGYAPINSVRSEDLGIAGNASGPPDDERSPICVILEPTRDLAQQTYACILQYSKYLSSPDIRALLCTGGRGNDHEIVDKLRKGVDVVVGTLRAITHLSLKGDLCLNKLRFLILDEGDELLKNDDREFVSKIQQRAMASVGRRVQTLFVSATLHDKKVRGMIENLTHDAVWVDLKGRPHVPDSVRACLYVIDANHPERYELLLKSVKLKDGTTLLDREPPTDGVHANEAARFSGSPEGKKSQINKSLKPRIAVAIADTLKMPSCLIFCRTNVDCTNMETYLNSLGAAKGAANGERFRGKREGGKENPYSCVVLAGMRDQREREQNLAHFKEGDVRFLICTDVAARGIDIPALPFMIMMNIPDDIDQWFHRAGRVGRAQILGLAITLACTEKEKVWYHANCRNKGVGCTKTNLVSDGGCCIWYDDPNYKESLEDLLEVPLPVMTPDTLFAPGILDTNQSSSDPDLYIKIENHITPSPTNTAAAFGQSAPADSASQPRYNLLPAAQELSNLEEHLQNMYLKIAPTPKKIRS
ncbi:putative ATP-dependent RNA helicase [Gregarina niphandrodes]|uniref:DEAD box protein 1 n=1 Tax=Gregarina niphandrodes TaxID=110365 RepID=A0A023B7Z1_GRENI|nr:putative ATP-dependent RNA helicase [Gregarina niphandrodes]EZG68162.1 putative ATP-dependent RNA helicase [Gregarina niphandrodes]|eukprot:XP_011130056.1 putative ATP-dependent RNA helicase [Gregarina niphandrodes]